MNLTGHKTTADAATLTDQIYSVVQTVTPFMGLIASTYFRTMTDAPVTGIVKAK